MLIPQSMQLLIEHLRCDARDDDAVGLHPAVHRATRHGHHLGRLRHRSAGQIQATFEHSLPNLVSQSLTIPHLTKYTPVSRRHNGNIQ